MDFSKALERDQQRKREYAMYGCYEDELRKSIESSITFKVSGPVMVAAGVMSDAQELLAMGRSDAARKQMNIAKFILSEMMDARQTERA